MNACLFESVSFAACDLEYKRVCLCCSKRFGTNPRHSHDPPRSHHNFDRARGFVFNPTFVRPIRRPRPPFFDAQTERRAMDLEVVCLGHHALFRVMICHRPDNYPSKDARVTPLFPSAVKSLVRTVLFVRISTPKANAIDEYILTEHAHIIDPRLTVGLLEVGIKTRNLRVAQPEEVAHDTAHFSNRESCRQTEFNGSCPELTVQFFRTT